MRALLMVELTRFRWRRAVVLIVLAAIVVPALIFAATAWNTRPVSDAELRAAEQAVAEQTQRPDTQRQLRKCVAKPERFGVPPTDDVQTQCEEFMLPQVRYYVSRAPLAVDNELRQGSVLGVAVVLTMMLLLVGTTFIGHDWNSGSMSNQLLFEPRRLRVWAAKGAIVLATGLVLAGMVLACYWGGLLTLAHLRDVPVRDGVVSAGYGVVLRGALLAAFAALGGYALTMLFRSTVATLGVMFAIAIAGPLLITLIGFPGNQRYMPQNNYSAVLFKDTTYFDETACAQSFDGGCDGTRHLGLGGGTTYFATLLLLAGVPSLLSFRRRDVP